MGCSVVQANRIEAPRLRKLAAVCLAVGAGGLLASCSASASSARTTVPPSTAPAHSLSGASCHQTFVLPGKSDCPSSPDPSTALAAFLRSGSMAAPGLPVVNPVSDGLPSGGWEVTTSTATQATYSSHGSSLVLTHSGNGRWRVYRGSSTTC